jgi:pyrroloquinoline quinone (PQQ) biosynthesis protein C
MRRLRREEVNMVIPEFPLTADEFMKLVDDEIDQTYRVINEPFARAWIDGTLSIEAMRGFVAQLAHHLRLAGAFHSRIASGCPDLPTRQFIISNAAGEDGVGGGRPHLELILDFGEAIGMPRELALQVPPLPETVVHINSLMELISRSFVEGIATFYAIEPQGPEFLGQFVHALRTKYGIDDPRLFYFDEHVEADTEHGNVERDIMVRFAALPAWQERVWQVIHEAIPTWRMLFFDGLQRSYVERGETVADQVAAATRRSGVRAHA